MKKLIIIFTSLLLSSCVISVTSELPSSSPPSTSTSIDTNTYFEVALETFNQNVLPWTARVDVRVEASSLSKAQVLLGLQQIANDFYLQHLETIGANRVDVTMFVFNKTALLTNTATYGSVKYVINETSTLLGIQFKEESISLS
jgi:hypothetical protein